MGAEASLAIHADQRRRAHINALIVIGEFQPRKHPPDDRRLAGTGFPVQEGKSRALPWWRAQRAVNGVGRETADSILCYALGKRFFVVDAYTRRAFSRHGWADARADYDELRGAVERAMPRSAKALNEFHALIVRLGKLYCRKKPLCEDCPLAGLGVRKWNRSA